MGEFSKDQGQANQAGQQTDKSAFGQFDRDENLQGRSERGQQDRVDISGAETEPETSSARESEIAGQGSHGKAGQQGERDEDRETGGNLQGGNRDR